MNQPNKMLDDFSRMIGGAAEIMLSTKREWETIVRNQCQRFLSKMDLVTREEFEALKQMASNTKEELDKLKAKQEVKKSSAKKS